MIATTETDSSNMDESSRRVFNEVSVFFAAMTRAITNTPRPGSNENYSIYNYEALAKVIGGSGCFIHCTQEDIKYTSSSFGANFSKELLSALLALPTKTQKKSRQLDEMIARLDEIGKDLKEANRKIDSLTNALLKANSKVEKAAIEYKLRDKEYKKLEKKYNALLERLSTAE